MTSALNDSRRLPPRIRRLAWLALAGGVLLPSPAVAQTGSTGPSPKRATAVRAPGPIAVDGRLDDAAWAGTIPGSISRPGFLGDAFGVPGDNYLAIKISYWLPVG